MEVGCPVLAAGARREMCLSVGAETVLDRQQQVLGRQVGGEHLGFGRQTLAQPLQLGRLRGGRLRMDANRLCRKDVCFLQVDELRLAFDAIRHVLAERLLVQLAFSVEQ